MELLSYILIKYKIFKYYIFAKKHRKYHKGGCVPYEDYSKLFKIVKNFYLKSVRGKENLTKNPENAFNILEIGTATGFTSYVINLACGKNCKIDTIDKNLDHINIARKQFFNAKFSNINLINAKAEEFLKNINKNYYDVVFFDAFAPKIENAIEFQRILKNGGLLISANSFLRKTEEGYFDVLNNKDFWLFLEEFNDTKIFQKVF